MGLSPRRSRRRTFPSRWRSSIEALCGATWTSKEWKKIMITDLLYIVALYLVSICSLLGCLDLLLVKYLHVKIDRYLCEVRKRMYTELRPVGRRFCGEFIGSCKSVT